MSQLPQPYSIPPSARAGRLPAIGTVSMCPASTTRSGRPSVVRATTALPSRCTSRYGMACSAAVIAVSQRLLVAADRGHVHQGRGQRGRILGKVKV